MDIFDRTEFYIDNGFGLFKCQRDKSPEDGLLWRNPKNHMPLKQAVAYSKAGNITGAAIPKGMIILDVDKKTDGGHKDDGEKPFQDLLKALSIDDLSDTFIVKTPSGGYHYYFYYDGSSPGVLTTGVDIKKSGGYVITATTDGYNALNDNDPVELPESLSIYISELKSEDKKKEDINIDDPFQAEKLKEILNFVPTEKFNTNDLWFNFCASVVTLCGNSDEIINILEDWSRLDRQYASEKSIRPRLISLIPNKGIGIGTFVNSIKPFKNAYALYRKERPAQQTEEKKTEEPESVIDEDEKMPFKLLGYSETGHYFMGRDDMITKTPKCKLTSGHLLEIAPLSFWADIKTIKNGGPDWTYIYDLIISLSIQKGPYKKSSIRGVGIWEDNGEIIASDGENVITKNGKVSIRDYKSDYTYIRRAPLGIKSIENKRHKEDLDEIKWICENISFKTVEDGKLLFGWIISSLFLSTISWRPVAYMKGPSSVGKSWTMNNIVRSMLGEICICPNKLSTVKGVMQAPGHDARMITIDELESSAEKGMMDVVKGLMTLARDSTTKNKEARYIGTADQEGLNTDFISMFLFASIVESSEEDQDVNRITAINFAHKQNSTNWEEIESKVMYLMDGGLGERIRYNAIFHRESIVKNIRIFRLEAGKIASKQRAGDQLGTIVAGWYHLENPGKIVSREEAREFLESFDFSDQNDRGKGKMMEVIMSPILSYKVKYDEEQEVKSNFNPETGDSEIRVIKRERTVYSVLKELDDIRRIGEPTNRHFLNKVLMDYGIRYGTNTHLDKVIIALNHEGVKKMFPQTFAYKSNYFDYFKNHDDFIDKEKSVKFNGVVFQAMVFKVDFEDEELLF